MPYTTKYREALNSGKLRRKVEEACSILSSCRLCPRYCEVDRTKGEKGFCKVGAEPMYSSYGPHYGEESPLVGTGGSGTIFLTGCNLGCLFCQNYDISHEMNGKVTDIEEMAAIMLALEKKGCHNINFVTPTHQMPQLLSALELAARAGLNTPVVWNCSGYESPESLAVLDGVVDIYMPDFKFSIDENAYNFTGAGNFWEITQNAIKEMYRQVGELVIEDGIGKTGLLVRHLVLPRDLAGSEEVFKFIAKEITPDTYVNVLGQYRPCYKAWEYEGLERSLSSDEYSCALETAKKAGLRRLDQEVAPRRKLPLFDIKVRN
ncbi:MAG: radical SAM protein [Chloroflexi bacterium]|nr:radical SAM protein [Chloroflexota bacterium]